LGTIYAVPIIPGKKSPPSIETNDGQDTQESQWNARRRNARHGLARNGPPHIWRPHEGQADDEQARKDCEPQGPCQRQEVAEALGQGRIQGQEGNIQARQEDAPQVNAHTLYLFDTRLNDVYQIHDWNILSFHIFHISPGKHRCSYHLIHYHHIFRVSIPVYIIRDSSTRHFKSMTHIRYSS
jgi:hypothetical protein